MSTLQADFTELKAGFDTHRYASLAIRLDRLARLRALVRDNLGRLESAIGKDFGGRAAAETKLLEGLPLLSAIRHARKHLARWMRDDARRVDLTFQPAKAWVRYEPLGVVGIISPWNYPLLLTLGPLVDALAAGNRVMLKPSELTPAFSSAIADLVRTTFSRDEVSVVEGGVEVAESFASLPFDHLLFTGSTRVGRRVALAAAENLTPVTLELGGKSPAIVCPDYPLAKAARSIAFGKFINAGQTCVAPDYVLAPEDSIDELASALLSAVQRSYPDLADNPDYSAVISPRHRERLDAAIQEAHASSAQVVQYGAPGLPPNKAPPTLVINPSSDSLLMREEIFGPVLPIVPYKTLQDATAFVRGHDKPLALYCFTDRSDVRKQVLSETTSGGVTVNGTLLHLAQDDLPFGGVGPSGQGAYHGHAGFLRFSHARAVYKVGALNSFERLGPPWGRLAELTGELLMRR